MKKLLKKSAILALSITLLSSFTACKKDKEYGTIDVQVKALYNNAAFEIDQVYATNTIDSISFSKINFFVSSIEFISTDNKSIAYNPQQAYFIDLENPNTLSFKLSEVEQGSYKQIKLGIGLPPSINSKDPSEFPISSVLSDVTHYWASWNSYIFSRLEGTLVNQNTARGNIPFLYHSGIDGTYQTIVLNKDFSITEQSHNINLVLNIEQIIYPTNGGQDIDIRYRSSSHGGMVGSEDYNISLQSIQNIANAISIE